MTTLITPLSKVVGVGKYSDMKTGALCSAPLYYTFSLVLWPMCYFSVKVLNGSLEDIIEPKLTYAYFKPIPLCQVQVKAFWCNTVVSPSSAVLIHSQLTRSKWQIFWLFNPSYCTAHFESLLLLLPQGNKKNAKQKMFPLIFSWGP